MELMTISREHTERCTEPLFDSAFYLEPQTLAMNPCKNAVGSRRINLRIEFDSPVGGLKRNGDNDSITAMVVTK
jgi:hypothetical protein